MKKDRNKTKISKETQIIRTYKKRTKHKKDKDKLITHEKPQNNAKEQHRQKQREETTHVKFKHISKARNNK